MALLITAARRMALAAMLAVSLSLLFSSPAAAHAELVNTTPANGAQLTKPPTEIEMTFTESVNLLPDGIRLVDGAGAVPVRRLLLGLRACAAAPASAGGCPGPGAAAAEGGA